MSISLTLFIMIIPHIIDNWIKSLRNILLVEDMEYTMERFLMIGNAVPPVFSKKLAQAIYCLLFNKGVVAK